MRNAGGYITSSRLRKFSERDEDRGPTDVVAKSTWFVLRIQAFWYADQVPHWLPIDSRNQQEWTCPPHSGSTGSLKSCVWFLAVAHWITSMLWPCLRHLLVRRAAPGTLLLINSLLSCFVSFVSLQLGDHITHECTTFKIPFWSSGVFVSFWATLRFKKALL